MPREPASSRVRLPATAVALLLAMVAAYAFVTVPVFAHHAQRYFGMSEGYLGFVLSSFAIGSLISLLLVGPATDRLGPRRVLQVCLAGVGVAFLMCGVGMGGSLYVFQAGLLTAGFFGAAEAVSLPAFLICLYPRWRRRMVTVSLISMAIPGMLFPVLAQWLLARVDAGAIAFADALHVPFTLGALILLPGQLLLNLSGDADEENVPEDEQPRLQLRSVLTAPALLIILCAALHAGADNALFAWLPKFLQSGHETLVIGTGAMLAAYSGAYLIARLGLAALPEGVGQRAFLVLPGPIGGALLIAVLWLGGPLAIALAYVVMGLLVALEYPALLAEIREGSAARFSAVYGASIWAGNLIAIVNTNVIGQIGQRAGDLRIGLTIAALGFLAVGAITWATGMGRHHDRPEGTGRPDMEGTPGNDGDDPPASD